MPLPHAQRVVLTAHPSTPSDVIGGLEVQVRATAAGVLAFEYTLWADMARVRLMEPVGAEQAAGPAEELWKHTCFEVFIASGARGEYDELNFSPAKRWAAYHFDAYRHGMSPLTLAVPPEICVRRARQCLELDALVRLLPAGAVGHAKLALCAVVEEEDGTLRYWAARHPPGKPDFHHPDGFVVELTGGS